MVDQAKDMVGAHLMNSDLFNEAGWRYIVDKHGGCLPLVIKARLARLPARLRAARVTCSGTVPRGDFNDPWFQRKPPAHSAGRAHVGRVDAARPRERNAFDKRLSAQSVPEGTVVPAKNVLFTMENTDPECYWLTNYMETLLVQIWHPMTVCTNSRCQKKIIADALKARLRPPVHLRAAPRRPRTHAAPRRALWLTAPSLRAQATDSWGPVGTMFKLHDFGYRGVSSVESAATGGAAHLVNFSGTDTMAGYMCARQYYNEPMAGFSIPAAEHSTITSWGRDGETEAFRNMLVQYKDSPLVAVVSDSYDIIKACTDIWGGTLKEMVKERGANGGQLVVRPDSGDPATIVVEVLEALGKSFAEDCSTTSTGHKLLPPYLRVIQGDGVSIESLTAILENMIKHNWAADNLAFGSGGALLQKLNRDTQKCAFKCSAAIVDGVERCVYKDPITDKGKLSKKGRLSLENIAYPATEEAFLASGIFGKFDAKLVGTTSIMTVCEGKGNPANNMLVEVFRDGVLTKEWSFAEVRALAELDVVKEMTAKAAAPPEGEAPKLSA